MRRKKFCVSIAALFGLQIMGQAHAQDVTEQPRYFHIGNPADTVREHVPADRSETRMPTTSERMTEPRRLRSFDMETVTVVGESMPELKEEERIGANEQPRWTSDRRFPSTRIYVQPPGVAQFEFWLRPTSPRHGKTELRSLAELELGLPGRFQLDLYARTESESSAPTQVGESVELRYAFADWNRIWGNPTIYAEWSRLENDPDAIEVKLLFGGEIAPRWHWGLNLSDELTTGGARENEIEVTGGISHTLIDSRFSVGVETEDGAVDTHNHRGTFGGKFFFVGPSFQYLPTSQIHIDFAPMVGVAHESPGFRAYFVVGYEF